MRVLIRRANLDETGKPTAMTATARKVKAEMEKRDRLDRELIEACLDLAKTDPDALKAVDVK